MKNIYLTLLCSFLILLINCKKKDSSLTDTTFRITSSGTQTISLGDEYRYDPQVEGEYEGILKFSLSDVPEGMSINPRTGVVTWMPSFIQPTSGEVTLKVTAGTKEATEKFTVTVSIPSKTTSPSGIFVSPSGTDPDGGADGTIGKPYSFEYAGRNANPGDTIYLRGGIYKYSVPNTAIRIKTNGTVDNPIIYTHYGNEKPKIIFEGSIGIRLDFDCSHVILDGLEVQGVSDLVTYEEAITQWWYLGISDDANRYNGNGIVIKGNYLTVRNCLVHNATGTGIQLSGGDHVVLEGNIVYNNTWWTAKGTNGISITRMPLAGDDVTSETVRVRATGNLVFANEQRIYSHVFSKGFTTLEIDEGGGILVQPEDNGNVIGKYIVEDNLILYNGKALVFNKAKNSTARYNTLYMNGTTLGGSFAGIRNSTIENCTWENNAVQVRKGHMALSVGTEVNCSWSNNYAVWPDYKENKAHDGLTVVPSIFANPENLDFSNSYNVGIRKERFDFLMERAKEYSLTIQPTGYVVDHSRMVADIINSAPADPAAVGITDADNFYLRISHDVTLPDGVTLDEKGRYYIFR